MVPIHFVSDAGASAEWYRRLGFETDWERAFTAEFPRVVSVSFAGRPEMRVLLSEYEGDTPPGGIASLRVDDLDRIATEFGVEIETTPTMREFRLTDPDGYRYIVSQPVAGSDGGQ